MTIANNHILRCSLVWNVAGETQVNVHYVKVTSIVAQTQAQIRADLAQYFSVAYAFATTWMSTALLHDRTEIFIVTTSAPEDPMARDATLDGDNAGEILPAQTAAEVYWRTGATRHIGRTFLPTFTEAANAGGQLAAGTLNDLDDFGGALRDAFTATNGVVCQKGIYDKSAGLLRFITSYVVPLHFRTQRRRRVGVGG